MATPGSKQICLATNTKLTCRLLTGAFCAMTVVAIVLSTVSNAWANEKVLVTFQGRNGSQPESALIFDAEGNLYGTTPAGGVNGNGVVFKLTPSTNGHWKQTILYSFNTTVNPKMPWGPFSGVLLDTAGNLYGTTFYGGASTGTSMCPLGCGTVFKLSPTTQGPWKESTLYSFRGERDGGNPNGGVVFDGKGNLYGTTVTGGANVSGCPGCGTIFELTPTSKGPWKLMVLHAFTGQTEGGDGAFADATLTLDGAGNLDGTTLDGGAFGGGTVFQLSPNSTGTWNYSVIHSFPVDQLNGTDGTNPLGGVIADASGNLYGTTLGGGTQMQGAVFELTPSSSGWTSTVLYSFQNLADGSQPAASLIFGATGNLCGTVRSAGSYGQGAVFELSPSISGGWTETVLYSFQGAATGSTPYAGLVRDALGNLYGTAEFAGSAGNGVVFEVTH
jgi:uncharacterized repeat protein (TIGR03803 family)